MDLVDEAAEVAQQQLADPAQIAKPPPQLAAARARCRAELELAGIDAGGKVAGHHGRGGGRRGGGLGRRLRLRRRDGLGGDGGLIAGARKYLRRLVPGSGHGLTTARLGGGFGRRAGRLGGRGRGDLRLVGGRGASASQSSQQAAHTSQGRTVGARP